MDLAHPKMKIDLALGPSRRDRLAQKLVRRSLIGTLMAVEIQIAPAVVSSHRSVRKSLPWKESENT
jgi:hypothetical protein